MTSIDVHRLQGAEVYSLTGSIVGRIAGALVDEDGSPAWLEVRTGLLDRRGMVLVPVEGAVVQGRTVTVLASDPVVAEAPGWQTTLTTPTASDLEQSAAFWQARSLYGAPRDLQQEVLPLLLSA